MKVCILVTNNCTVDSRILRQAETFSRAGHETVIVAVHRGDVPAVEDREGFQIRRVPSQYTWREGFPRLIGWPARLLGRRPLEIGAWKPSAMSGAQTSPAAPNGTAGSARGRLVVLRRRALRAIRRTANQRILYPTRYRIIDRRIAREAIRFHADLYWANDTMTIRPARVAARATGARSVYDAHEVIWDAPTISALQRRRWGAVERTHIKDFDHRITVCDPIAHVMAQRYRIPAPIVVLNCPRLEATLAAPNAEGSPLNAYRKPGERLILFHGSLSIHRGLEQLVDAMAILGAGYRLIVLGHGAFRTTLEARVADRGVTDQVTFLQSVPPAELPGWIAGADVGTIPYQRIGRNHEYSTPNKLFEYMHLGVPIIANDLPEITRIMADAGGFGITTDCADPKAMASAIEELCGDEDRRARMRAAALEAAPRYSWEAQEPLILQTLA